MNFTNWTTSFSDLHKIEPDGSKSGNTEPIDHHGDDRNAEQTDTHQAGRILLEVDKQISSLRNELIELENRIIEKVNPNRSKAVITFRVENVKLFYKDKKARNSAPEFCRNMLWCLSVQHHATPDKKDYLHLYLCPTSKFENREWQLNGKFEFKICSQTAGIPDKISQQFTYSFPPDGKGYGVVKFYDWDELFDPENGFRKNDTLIFQVVMEFDLPISK